MIPFMEFMEFSNKYNVPITTIERDYVQNCILKYLDKPYLVLKGGTGIRKLYFRDYRFSDDLDFTLTDLIDSTQIIELFSEIIKVIYQEYGISFHDDIKLKETKTGFRFTLYFQINNPVVLSMKFDLTKIDYEEILLPIKKLNVFNPYSDEIIVSIQSYALEEIFTEKIRSVFQRTRSRDIYDIVQIEKYCNKNQVKKILSKKMNIKNVEYDLNNLIKRKEEYGFAWNNSLKTLMSKIPDFDFVFNEAIKILRSYSY